MRRAISKHARDFAFVVGTVLVAAVVGGYILSNQRLYLPKWVPALGSDFVDYKAELQTAQSVTPGQGQTVQIAGVDIGQISSVRLHNGRALVGMKLRRKYTPIYRDATALLRPKTGLNDMVVQLDPGSRAAGAAPKGWTIPVSQTLPNVNLDEILASLDSDTQDYLQLLLAAGGQGLGGQSAEISATLKRFEPTGRYLAKINGALATRQRNIRRSIHNFSLLSQALGSKDDQLAALVDSSNRVFTAFANQSERLRETLQELPGALRATDSSLTKVDALASELGPTLEALRPAARALGPSLKQTRPFLRDTTPVIRDQLRPFARDVLPTVKVLRPAARDLAEATPNLTSSLRTVNELLNELTYNPPGAEEGYLYWASWLNHNGNTVFGTSDAHGPIRRGVVMSDCSTLGVLDTTISKATNQLGLLTQLLNAPAPGALAGCPKNALTAAPTATTGATR